MKKIKKILLLLLAFSFTTLLFNSQAYAVNYYEFTFDITDVSNVNDIVYTSNYTYQEIADFMINYGTPVGSDYDYIITLGEKVIYYNTTDNFLIFTYSVAGEIAFIIYSNGTMIDTGSSVLTVGIYTFTTRVSIFIQTFWDQIIDVVGDIASAFQAAASAGISLIYDGTALTSLGEVITITLGVGLVIGLFYLVIRVLPGARL